MLTVSPRISAWCKQPFGAQSPFEVVPALHSLTEAGLADAHSPFCCLLLALQGGMSELLSSAGRPRDAGTEWDEPGQGSSAGKGRSQQIKQEQTHP